MSLATVIVHHPRSALRFDFPTEPSEATSLAATNFERNRAALEARWPRTVLALPETLPELEWLFARDGALSARHIDRRWFNDISVPRRAAERMIKQLVVVGSTAVMLAPTHACQVRRALDLLAATQALIVIVPGESNAGVIVACEDFSADIKSGRLWLAVGPDWQEELKAILDGNDGLAAPQTMIRVPGLNVATVELISRPCEVMLATHHKVQRQLVNMLHAKPRFPQRPVRKACLIVDSFKLWDSAGQLLNNAAASSSLTCVTVDASSSTQASDLRLARAADGCDVVVTANIGRAERPGVVPDSVPWITWVTGATVPTRVASAKADRLVVADPAMREAAIAASWPASSISIASEPREERPAHDQGTRATPAIIFDLPAITLPKSVEEMSSLRLVWELIERELVGQALRQRADVDAFILSCADRVGVPRESFPLATFRDRLVSPLFARELAIEFASKHVAFAIYGDGWASVPQVASRWRGAVTTSDEFAACIAATSVILDVWAAATTHAARRTGRPIVKAWGRRAMDVLSALQSPTHTPPTAEAIFKLDEVVAQLAIS